MEPTSDDNFTGEREDDEIASVPSSILLCKEAPFQPLENLGAVHVPTFPMQAVKQAGVNDSKAFTNAVKQLQVNGVDIETIDSVVNLRTLLSSLGEKFRLFQVEQLRSQCSSLLERSFAAQVEFQWLR